MSLRRILHWLECSIVLAALVSSTWLYLYPVFKGCAFPSTSRSSYDGFTDTIALHRARLHEHAPSLAPFRLLVLADPQLEGDSSLPDPDEALSARVLQYLVRIREAELTDFKAVAQQIAKDFFREDLPKSLWAARKTLDLFGNDYYLAHIYRTLHWWSKPSHVTVLGDLIGSQWVSDDEFEWRGWRYWNRVLAGAHPTEEEIMSQYEQEERPAFSLETSDASWSEKIINIVGNHDIGYAGDISPSRIERFEKTFGRVNWDIHFEYPHERLPINYTIQNLSVPSVHLIVLNSMILDTPAKHNEIQQQTYDYLNGLIGSRLDTVEDRNTTFTLLLTHVPLHKPEGTCVDAPFFDFWDYEDAHGAFKNGGLKEQNHLSEHSSQSGVLQGIFGMSGNLDAIAGGKGRNGLILTGHDHEGCDTVHYIERSTSTRTSESSSTNIQETLTDSDAELEPDQSTYVAEEPDVSWSWKAVRTEYFANLALNEMKSDNESTFMEEVTASVREITLRSMMGEYSGNAGLLSMWYDFDANSWTYEMQMCPLGVQHIWWAIHVIDVVATLIIVTNVLVWCSYTINAQCSKAEMAERPSRPVMKTTPKTGVERVQAEAGANGHQRSPSERRRKG